MNEIESKICNLTAESHCRLGPIIQQLWSGYGVIQKATIGERHVVIKRIDTTRSRENRRGWQSPIAHERKINSYLVEINFYRDFVSQCNENCLAPEFIAASDTNSDDMLLVMEDLDESGFPQRKEELSFDELKSCLFWLANFHATFLGKAPNGLWKTGTYWHLETRPQELNAMRSGPLKELASNIDSTLNAAKHQTFVHGDAKVANFCFPNEHDGAVAAVDFQYVGKGAGVKDVAYFVSSCLNDVEAKSLESAILDYYFNELKTAVQQNSTITWSDESNLNGVICIRMRGLIFVAFY